MITIDLLNRFGADTKEGLSRCLGNEEFYLKMVGMGIQDERFESMETVLSSKDLEGAFEMAHALKGVLGNLALTPIYQPMSEMTQLLRTKEDADYMSYYKEVLAQRQRLLEMAEDEKKA